MDDLRLFKKALALLLCDEGPNDPAVADQVIGRTVAMSSSSMIRLRQRCCETGPVGALVVKPRDKLARQIKVTCEIEACITQLACIQPPEGPARWNLRRQASRRRRSHRKHLPHHRRTGLKDRAQTWRQEGWFIPPKHNAAFVVAMEGVLEGAIVAIGP